MIDIVLSALGGFLAPSIRLLFQWFQDKKSDQHALNRMQLELEIKKLDQQTKVQMQAQAQQAQDRLAAYQDQSDARALAKAQTPLSPWIMALRSSVRPVLTYAFFGLFVAIKVATLILVWRSAYDLDVGIDLLWDAPTQALLAIIMGFWFGGRVFQPGPNLV